MQIPSWLEHDIAVCEHWAVLVAVMLERLGVRFSGETAPLTGANRMLWHSFLFWNARGRTVWAIV